MKLLWQKSPVESGSAAGRVFRSGFAAGCAARLCLAVGREWITGSALGAGFALDRSAKGRTSGRAHLTFLKPPSEAEPRRTSGGGAAAKYF